MQYPGGNSLCGPLVNSFVHTIMYLHYALTVIGKELPVPKNFVTILQLVQFVFLMAQALYCIYTDYAYWPPLVCCECGRSGTRRGSRAPPRSARASASAPALPHRSAAARRVRAFQSLATLSAQV